MKSIKIILTELYYGNTGTVILRIALGVIFILAGLSKIIDPVGFSRSVSAYGIVSKEFASYVAIVIPTLEMVLGLLLVIGYKIKSAVFSLLCLMMIFSFVIIINIMWGKSFKCGCFNLPLLGPFIDGTIGPKLLIRNAVIIIFLFILFFAKNNLCSLDTLIDKIKLRNI